MRTPALHPQLGVLAAQPGQLSPIVAAQTLCLTSLDLILLHPVTQGLLTDPQVTSHPGDRFPRLSHDPDRSLAELRIEPTSCLWFLITDREDWPVAEVVTGYRSQSEAEFSFRQLKDPHVVSFSPMHHWTDHNIRVHIFTCVLALQIAHLMRRHTHQHGLHLSVRELLDTLAGIEETVLIYPSTGGRPKARRMLTETTPQDHLAKIFDLPQSAPRT